MNNHDQDILLEYIRKLLYDTNQATLDRSKLSLECERLADGLEYLGEVIKDEKRVLDELADGKLDAQFKISHNYLAGPVKTIQSDLIHLAWVAQRVASGDYQQKVSNLGRFSDSFNQMVEQLSRYRDEMETIRNTDALTGTKNRRSFNEQSEKLWKENKIRSIAFIDLDGLKYCNDTYGHSYGDEYIQMVCDTLFNHLKDQEELYRMGGDEFLILSQKEDCHHLEERLMSIREDFLQKTKEKVPYPCDFSFGCVDVDISKMQSMSECLSLADKKMYSIKIKKHHYR